MGETTVANHFRTLQHAVTQVLAAPEIAATLEPEHVSRTPERVALAFQEYFKGCYEDPRQHLKLGFTEDRYDQMLMMARIGFFSTCQHHWAPFFGKVHFAYVPKLRLVGLSKIPRFIEILARRPQLQEKFSDQIVDIFQEEIQPAGCGVLVEAYHLCVSARGVECEQAFTTTTSLRGCFTDGDTKMEFLMRVPKGESVWP